MPGQPRWIVAGVVADYAPFWLRVVPWIVAVLAFVCVAAEVEQWRRERRNRRRGE